LILFSTGETIQAIRRPIEGSGRAAVRRRR
jgi:hypothetical protein